MMLRTSAPKRLSPLFRANQCAAQTNPRRTTGNGLRGGYGRTAIAALSTFVLACLAPTIASADPATASETIELTDPELDDFYAESDSHGEPEPSTSGGATQSVAPAPSDVVQAPHSQGQNVVSPPQTPLGLPSGDAKSTVTSQAISIPKGNGTIEGMGESFSAQLSTGIATFSVPFALPHARGGAQPALGLSYSSSSGFGNAGVGWDAAVPFIARQTDRGIPNYQDFGSWHPERDRFVFNGGQELVPVCVVGDATYGCSSTRLQSDGPSQPETLPIWATTGWEYYRPRVEGSFLRFFWSPDRRTWRVQSKDGVTMEFGVAFSARGLLADEGGLERNPDAPNEIYRWHLVRQYDTYGTANPEFGPADPFNQVIYRYQQDAGRAYLTDIYDTSPATDPRSTNLSEYAHHTRVSWDLRPDPTFSYRSGWRIDQRLRMTAVEVSSKTFMGTTGGAFRRARLYHLEYDDSFHVSLLKTVQVEGRCTGTEDLAPLEGTNDSCGRLPAMTFDYSHVQPTPGPLGYEDFDAQQRTLANSPKYSLDEALTDLFDVNSDSLPDVVVTAGALFGNKHGLYFNGVAQNGVGLGFTPSTIDVSPLGVPPGIDENILKFSNSNVRQLDLDGDGLGDLVHMPIAKKYEVFSPALSNGSWIWRGRTISTASQQNVKINFTNENSKIRTLDVNFDGLVDVVVTTGTEIETFYSLGRYPPASGQATADGQFGKAVRTSASASSVSNDPVATCVPWSATPVQFSDPDIMLADMNGDGITDIARVRSGEIRYWPGRGNGFWGTGKRGNCPAGTYGQNRHIPMASSPNYQVVQGNTLLLDDVNGDGLADLVEIRFNAVDVYLNVDGVGWTERQILANTPSTSQAVNRVRLTDINGSGTSDIVWGDGLAYKYIDLQGGKRPWLLTKVENGLGKTTNIAYSTSTEQMLAAALSGHPWTRVAPSVVSVVSSVTESDNRGGSYTTEYTYRDPVYEGRQREFRGFRSATARRLGDWNVSTDYTDSTFLLGECVDETADAIDDCAVSERWRDNPREALKGLPVVTEKRDERGRYLSTEVAQYRLRHLYSGLDGRAVRHAFEQRHDTYLYDNAEFVSDESTINPTTVLVELSPPNGPVTALSLSTEVTLRSSNGRKRLASESTVDVFGNRTSAIARGCVEGCAANDEIITTSTAAGRPANDPTGWLWRTTSSAVTGSAYFLGSLQATTNTYDAQGALVVVQKLLQNTLGLDRFRVGGGAVAAAPAEASVNGAITWNTTYDAFGNLVRESGPNGRCRDVGYEDAYEQLADLEKVFVNGCDTASPTPFQTNATYDRSFGLALRVTDIQGQPTDVTYDGFGRLTTLTRPHPVTASVASPRPSVKVEYLLPPDLGSPGTPYSVVHTSMQDATLLTDDQYLESWTYVDGLGRTLVTLSEADISAGDDAPLIASGQVRFDAKGAVAAKYLDHFYAGAALSFPLDVDPATQNPPIPFGTLSYDGFGRTVTTTDLDGTVSLRSFYHALSVDHWDAADLTAPVGTPATETKDGHGRTVSAIERFREANVLKERETATTYIPTGQPHTITRKLGANQVKRWMRYDSLGRMVLNVEPNTTAGFTTDHTSIPASLKAWRYAYNDSGDLVGTSDARGCGVNFKYDKVGRLQYEDYSPCEVHHLTYGAPNLAQLNGVEVYYHYDSDPNVIADDTPTGYFGSLPAQFLRGRLVAVFDMGAITVSKFDGRGRVLGTARKIAKPAIFASSLASRYTGHWFEKTATYDSADREIITRTGASVAEVMAPDGTSTISTTYSHRGTVASATSSYGPLVTSTQRTADGRMKEIVYGDVAGTTTSYSYDDRRRLESAQTVRSVPGVWSSPPPNYIPTYPTVSPSGQLVLQDDAYEYDIVSNTKRIHDLRNASEWPAEAKPVDREFEYDDLYRLTRVDYAYNGGSAWQAPFASENTASSDPRLGKPVPHVGFLNRIAWQTYAYDWLGNTSSSDDDAHGFYDRSIGAIANSATKPYQLTSASNETTPNSPINKEGHLATAYDAAGNLVRLHVRRAGSCLPNPGTANCNQIFDYRWDEVGRLVHARRWDVTPANLGTPADPAPGTTVSAEAINTYDASDERVIEQTYGPGGTKQNVFVFDTLDIRRTVAVTAGSPPVTDYPLTKWTEVPYLFVNGVRLARVVYNESSPEIGANRTHVFLEIGDHLGSTSVVIDRATGELVERGTYQPYGAKESDYRPTRWQAFREDYGFTGKEEDIQVGLTYFGKRFLSPYLNRWVSADPLGIHGLGSDLNVYAYVSGRALKATDPLGLEGSHGESHPSSVSVDTPMEDVGVSTGPAEFMKWQPEAIAAEQARAQQEADFQAWIQARNDAAYMERAQLAGEAVASDRTPDIKAARAAQIAEYNLSIISQTTPLAPGVVTLQALTGNNDVAVVANHVGIIAMSAPVPPARSEPRPPSRHIGASGASKGERTAPFNPTRSRDNCVNGVCAFVQSVQQRQLVTASSDSAWNGGKIFKSNDQIIGRTGVTIGAPQFMEMRSRNDRQLFLVYKGRELTRGVADHIMIGMKNGNRTMMYDPQTHEKFFDSSQFGAFIAYPITW